MKLEKVSLFVLIAILIGGLSASPILQGSIGSVYAQTDEEDEMKVDEMETDKVQRGDKQEVQRGDKQEVQREYKQKVERDDDYYYDKYRLAEYCELSADEQKRELARRDDIRKHKERLDRYCEMSDEEREEYQKEFGDEYKERDMDKSDDLKEKLSKYCELSDEEIDELQQTDGKITDELRERLVRYCTLSEEEREDSRKMHHDVMMDFKETHLKMIDEKRFGHKFIREFDMRIASFCEMSEDELMKLMQRHEFLRKHHERLAEYCHMSEDQREDFRMTHRDMMDDFKEDSAQMRDQMITSHQDIRMQIQQKVRHYDISDEKRDEIRDKFRAKHSGLSDTERDEISDKIKTKYREYFEIRMKQRHDTMSELQKDQILKRHTEMKDYKADLRLKTKNMSEDERVEFQAEFRDRVSDKRFSWISPQKQMLAGIEVDEIECREGLNLVLKTSNGKAMCTKSSTAERMIERGLAIPAN